ADRSFPSTLLLESLLHRFPVRLVPSLDPSSDDQARPGNLGGDHREGVDEVLEPLVRGNLSEEQHRRLPFAQPESTLRLRRSELGTRRGLVNAKRNHCDLFRGHLKVVLELLLHLIGVHEKMIGEPILDSQSDPIEPTVVAVSPRGIDVMSGEDHLATADAVIEHQDGAIEVLELVVPQYVKDRRLRSRRVDDQPSVILQEATCLHQNGRILALISPQVEKADEPARMEFRCVHLVAPDELHEHTESRQGARQAKGVGEIVPSREKPDGYRWFVGVDHVELPSKVRSTAARVSTAWISRRWLRLPL